MDYPGVGPEHAFLKEIGRTEYRPITDVEAMDAFRLLCRLEGIIPAIESAHAVAGAVETGRRTGPGIDHPDQPVRARRQGCGDGGPVVRAVRQPGDGDAMTVQHSRPGRLGPIFETCAADGRAALIGYLPTGYPDVPVSIEAMVAMTESGCDIIEVGVPYSDPGMDGPVIATATESALQAGVRVRDTFRAVEAISAAGGSPVVMTYWNPVMHYGVDAFARDLAAAGGLGMITPT